MSKTLNVAAVKQGTVIDHIPENMALVILRFLHRSEEDHPITVGLHLISKKLGKKDMIKIHGRRPSAKESTCIAILAPNCTVNLIENYEVAQKFSLSRPEKIVGIFSCPRSSCITSQEKVPSIFLVDPYRKELQLTCSYCHHAAPADSLY